jgi:hypothetical protein
VPPGSRRAVGHLLQASQGAGDAGGVQYSEAAHLNSPKRALESQISMSHLVPLLEFNPFQGVLCRVPPPRGPTRPDFAPPLH